MNRIGILAYGAAIAVIVLIAGRETLEASAAMAQLRTTGRVGLGVAGWLIATLGPITLSVVLWLWAQRVKRRWALHLMFIPLAIAVFNGGAALLFFAADVPDGDSIEGYALLAASAILLLALLVHAAALIANGYKHLRLRRNGRQAPNS